MIKRLCGLMVIITIVACSHQATGPAPLYPSPLAENPSVDLSRTPQENPSLFSEDVSLYTNEKRYHKGDTLTIVVRERNDIQHDGEVDLLKSSEVAVSVDPDLASTLGPVGSIAAGLSNIQGSREDTHVGETTYQQSSFISDRITVVVSEVRSDGTLAIWGKRHIGFDGEKRTLIVNGLVHPRDIAEDNTVSSERIAMSTIEYSGQGTLTSTTEPGWGTKTFRWFLDAVWPF